MTRLARAGRFVERTLAVVGAFLIVHHVFFELSTISSGSMDPLLVTDDRILVERFFTSRKAPARRFSVVSFVDEDGVLIAKRLVGFPGETLSIDKQRILRVNGARIEVPEGVGDGKGYIGAGNLRDGRAFEVPEGHVYVLGDFTRDSQDSRWIGALPIAHIRGRAVLRVWPLRRFKAL